MAKNINFRARVAHTKSQGKVKSINSINKINEIKTLEDLEDIKDPSLARRYKQGTAIAAYLRGQELYSVGGRGAWSNWVYEGNYTFAEDVNIKFDIMAFPGNGPTRINYAVLTKNIAGGFVFEVESCIKAIYNDQDVYAIVIKDSPLITAFPEIITYIKGWRLGNIFNETDQVKNEYFSYTVYDTIASTRTIFLRINSAKWHNQNQIITNPNPITYFLTPQPNEKLSTVVRYACTCPAFQAKRYCAVFSSSESKRLPVTSLKATFADKGIKSLTRPENPQGQTLSDGLLASTGPVNVTFPGGDRLDQDFTTVPYDDIVPCKHIYAALLATNTVFNPPSDYNSKISERFRAKVREEHDTLKMSERLWQSEKFREDLDTNSNPFEVGSQTSNDLAQAVAFAVGLATTGIEVASEDIQISGEPLILQKSAYQNIFYSADTAPEWLPDPTTPNDPIAPVIGGLKGSSRELRAGLPPGTLAAGEWLRAVFSA